MLAAMWWGGWPNVILVSSLSQLELDFGIGIGSRARGGCHYRYSELARWTIIF